MQTRIYGRSREVMEIPDLMELQTLVLPGVPAGGFFFRLFQNSNRLRHSASTTLVRTGQLPQLNDLLAEIPESVLAILRIPGIGPKKAASVFHQLGVKTLDELKQACEAGRVRELKGFGAKTEARILRELGAVQAAATRIPRAVAAQYAEPLLAWLRDTPGVRHADIAGSFRRCTETVGDLDLLA